ncbi:hypothetical protein QJQ45_007880 [Haematococcus lacustris]|nr:hypothetical protein QJQ45_007880 [Haematococcus lacustris]
MEPGGPLPPQPPELTARYNKKLLTLEEISQAHASSVYAQKYSIEVVGGKIKAVCNDCKMVLSCGNLSDSRKQQCNKRPRSDQHAIAGGTSSDMLFERITACWNPDQRMPANIVAEFWRRLHMWFIDAEIPFAKSWPDELRSAGHPVPAIKGWVMDDTYTNKRAMQLMEDDDPEAINMGCAAHWFNLAAKDFSKPCTGLEMQALALAEERRAQAQQQQQQHAMPLLQQPGQV